MIPPPRVTTTRLYDTANRLDAITNRVPGGPVFASFDYTYDVPTHRSVVPGEANGPSGAPQACACCSGVCL